MRAHWNAGARALCLCPEVLKGEGAARWEPWLSWVAAAEGQQPLYVISYNASSKLHCCVSKSDKVGQSFLSAERSCCGNCAESQI